jgi:predicted  nucleic acid-binding Zn-ribbon protein
VTPARDKHLDELRAEAQYARQRYDLYRAKAYGQRPTTESRMRELEREFNSAEARLHAAEAEARRARTPGDTSP